jgi:O-antigen ligase
VFGLGADNFSRAEGTIGPLALNHVAGTGLRFMAPHNTPLQVAADMGIPAVLVWLSVILLGILWLPLQRRRFARDSTDPEERFLYQACTYLPAAWVGFFVSSLFVSFAYLVPYYIMLAYTAGVLLALRRWSGPGAWSEAPAGPAVPTSEWRSRRMTGASRLWQPRPSSAALQPGEGFAGER